MKKIFFILSILLFPISIHAIVLPDGTDARVNDIELDGSGKIKRAYLSIPTEINTPLGKISAVGEIIFNSDGKVIEFTPEKNGTAESPIGTLPYREYEPIGFYDSGEAKFLYLDFPTSLTVNGRTFSCWPSLIYFYENWKPLSFRIDKDVPIALPCGNIICKAYSNVLFFSNGNIVGVELAEPAEITKNDIKFYACDTLVLDTDETPASAVIYKSDGIPTKYGKIYPVDNSKITFYLSGGLQTIVPQDITLIQYDDAAFMTVAGETLGFDENGIINRATVKGRKFTIYGWSFEFNDENFYLVIYPNKKIYIPYTASRKYTSRLLIIQNCCYQWYPDKSTIYLTTKEAPDEYKHQTYDTKDSTPSHFTKEGKFDFYNCPLIFDEKDNLIGYRRSAFNCSEWKEDEDRYVDYANYNRITDEYENYVGDVFFDQQKN